MMRTIGALCLTVGALVSAGCGDSGGTDGGTGGDGGVVTCGPNETLMVVNGAMTCVVDSTKVCSTNTTPTDAGTCALAASACQAPGTVLDPNTHACVTVSDGTQVATANMHLAYNQIFTQNNTDGGVVYAPVGNFAMPTVMGLPSSTPLFNSKGTPLGGQSFDSRFPVNPQPAPFIKTPTALDHQITYGEWTGCNASVSFYKPPAPVGGKNVYKLVVTMAGCLPNSLWTVWFFYSGDGTRPGSLVGAPAGGVPNSLITDNQGAARYERYFDPNEWFKPGIVPPGGGAHVQPLEVPDPAKLPNAGVIVDLFWHSTGLPYDNLGFCEKDLDAGTCLPTQPPVANFLTLGVYAHQHLLNEPAISLTKLQPY